MTEVALSPSPTSVDTSALTDGETADAADVLTPFTNLKTAVDQARAQVSVSENDTHVGNLNDKITVSEPLEKTIVNDSGNEDLQLSLSTELTALETELTGAGKVPSGGMDSTGALSGYVPTADGAGNVSWAAQGGGGASPIDVAITAGENLSERDYVYINSSDNKAYKVDIDASPIACGPIRGVINEVGGILAEATGSMRILGEVSGFSGLTPWGNVWASTTAGAYTQVKPVITAGGGQRAFVRIGIATSPTNVLVAPNRVQFMKREALANAATMTLEHYADTQSRERSVSASISGATAGASATSYADSNQDDMFNLNGVDGTGENISISASGANWGLVNNGNNPHVAQSFTPASTGRLTQFTFGLNANTGTPTGDIGWALRADNSGEPDGVDIATGTHTPTASATNTVNISDGPILTGSTKYWMVFDLPTVQSPTTNAYNFDTNTPSVYAGGNISYATTGESSWTDYPTYDLDSSFTVSPITRYTKLAQSFQLGSGDTIDQIQLWMRKIGTPTGTMTLRLETNNAGSPSGTLVDPNATVDVDEATLTTSFSNIIFNFAVNPDLSTSTTYWIVVTTDRSPDADNYVEWGADRSTPTYANGEMRGEDITWGSLSADAIFDVIAQDTAFEGQCLVDFWTFETTNIVVRYDNGAAGNLDTNTTFKNRSGSALDVTCIVRLP